VRDHTGALAWIEAKAFGPKRMVLVTGASAEARTRPEDAAPLAFVAAQNVALELVEVAPAGWLRVRAADGADGYMRASQVWGS
jgi:SH3-like domain-containing protein